MGCPRRTLMTLLCTPVCFRILSTSPHKFQFSLSAVTLGNLSRWFYCFFIFKYQVSYCLCRHSVVVTGDMRAVVRIAIFCFLYFSTQLSKVNTNFKAAKQNKRSVFSQIETLCSKNLYVPVDSNTCTMCI